MKQIIHLFSLKCGHCSETFRAVSHSEEPPISVDCAHCGEENCDPSFMPFDEDREYEDQEHLAQITLDLSTDDIKVAEINWTEEK